MKKTLTALALAMSCICSHAQIAPNPSIPNDPVDYRLLRLPTDEPAMHAYYTIEFSKSDSHDRLMSILGQNELSEFLAEGKMTLHGSLIHSWDITPEYVERCIQKALSKSRIGTRQELARLIKSTPKFEDYTYTEMNWVSDMFGLTTGVVGFFIPSSSVASNIYGVSTSLYGMALANATESASTLGNVVSTAGAIAAAPPNSNVGSVAGNALTAFSIGMTIKDQMERDKKKWNNRAYLINMCRIDYFYNLVNAYLRQDAGAFDSIWVLSFPQTDWVLPFEFRGELCSVRWHINLGAIRLQYLAKKNGDVPEYDFEGEYFGYLNADLSFDFSNYDKNYIQKLSEEEFMGLKGKSNDPALNMMANSKSVITSDDVRSNLNMYKALPNYSMADIRNTETHLDIAYRTPIHIEMEVPTDRDIKMIEKTPDYFWDLYEDKFTEGDLRLSSVMRAMGVDVGSRETEVKVSANLLKSYMAIDQATKDMIGQKEQIVGDEYILRNWTNDKWTSETKIPQKDWLSQNGFSTTIPYGMARILWTSEIKPPSRNARETTEAQWKNMFDKYDLTQKFRW